MSAGVVSRGQDESSGSISTGPTTAPTVTFRHARRHRRRYAAPNARVELRDFPEPELEPDSALLEVELSEVCRTDMHLRAGCLAGVPYPLIPGHVTAGRLAKVRGTLRDVVGRTLREGDRVTFLDVHRTCNSYWYCLVGKATTRCPERWVSDITYGAADELPGG